MNGMGAYGIPCPKCGQREKSNVTARLFDIEGYDIGMTLHCLKCEHVWDDIFYSGRDREIDRRQPL